MSSYADRNAEAIALAAAATVATMAGGLTSGHIVPLLELLPESSLLVQHYYYH